MSEEKQQANTQRLMTLQEFRNLVVGDSPVVLLEGRRAISEQDASLARGFANRLAREFVRLRFRSGNAEGSDEAFSAGVAEVDASRLQVIAPYASHRTKKEAVTRALTDYIQHLRQDRILDLFGKVEFDPSYNHKRQRARA